MAPLEPLAPNMELLLEPNAELLPLEAPKLLPRVEAPATPFAPPGPMPPSVAPASGWPKKPIAVGALFWPIVDRLPLVLPGGGIYVFFAQEADSIGGLVNASTLGGYAPNFL